MGVLGPRAAGGQEVPTEEPGANIPGFLEVHIGTAPASRSQLPAWKIGEALLEWQRHLSDAVGVTVVVKLFDHLAELEANLAENPVAVSIVPAAMAPEIRQGVPVFLVENGKGLTSSFILVAPGHAQIGRGKKPAPLVLVDDSSANSWGGRLWAESVHSGTSLGGTRPVDGGAKVVIPVFFGQAEYGLLRAEDFAREVAKNPQVAQRVRVVAESPPLLGDVVVMSEKLGEEILGRLRREFAGGSWEGAGNILFRHLGWRAFRPVGERELWWIEESYAAVRDGQLAGGRAGADPQAANGTNRPEEMDVE